jgi:Protein of unknown function (DUF3071)
VRTLRLVALSDDGRDLVLTTENSDGTEERFQLPIDERVRAAARGDARLGAIEDLGNTLPPRVIQARIRAGETPEQVAQASGTRVERIMRFAHPVLQERARIAEQAREARVRLSDGTPTVSLQKFMTERLRLLGGDADGVHWDAHRDSDGTWLVTGTWSAGHKSGTTLWNFDIPARAVTPVDAATMDFAEGTRLVRVVPDVPGGGVAISGGAAPLTRRPVTSIRPAQPATGEHGDEHGDDHDDGHDDGHGPVDDAAGHHVVETDAIGPFGSSNGTGQPGDETVSKAVREAIRDAAPHGASSADPAFDDDIAEHDTVVLGRAGDEGEAEDPRARVPAWEDIVFGIRRHR